MRFASAFKLFRSVYNDVADTIRDLKEYDPASSLAKIRAKPAEPEPFKLDWNESTQPPSPLVGRAIEAFLQGSNHLNWYPSLMSPELCRDLSVYTGAPASSIVVTNGSDDALDLICRTYLNPGDEVLVPVPTYTHFFTFAQSHGGRLRQIRMSDPFAGDMQRIIDSINPRTKLVYVVNPNNPTGVYYGPDEISRLLEHAGDSLVIVDEAYHEFCRRTSVDLLRRYDNLAVTRSFSKAFGLAALRVGYIVTNEMVVRNLKRVHNPKSVNALAQIGASAALRDLDYMNAFVDEVERSKELVRRFCEWWGLEYRPTVANYINMRVPDPARFIQLLEEESVYIRNRSDMPGLKGFVRFSLGTTAQTREILSRFERVMYRLQ